ncbi:hypothetical protein GCM10010530_68410 [Kribbella aluminosa]
MSSVVGVIKEAGPYVVALVGMGAGYFGGRGTGRESRHHARVEALYQDMLDDLTYRSQVVHETIGVVVWGAQPVSEVPPVNHSRIQLYASPVVWDSWTDVENVLEELRLAGRQEEHQLRLLSAFSNAKQRLLGAMRTDLGVPKGTVIWRAGDRVSRGARWLRRRRAARNSRRLQAARRARGEVEGSQRRP